MYVVVTQFALFQWLREAQTSAGKEKRSNRRCCALTRRVKRTFNGDDELLIVRGHQSLIQLGNAIEDNMHEHELAGRVKLSALIAFATQSQ